jgi:hypothetical protein
MKSKLNAVCAGLTVVAGLGFSGTASADFASCVGPNADVDKAYDISGAPYVTTATACAILKPIAGQANDVPQPGFVNGVTGSGNDGNPFFGISDWLFDGKYDNGADGSSLFKFTTSGDPATTGSYEFVGPDPSPGNTYDIMFVFKDGNDTNLVGYLVTRDDGTYQNMFINPPFNVSATGEPGVEGDRISHISVYYREREQQTPEPASLALLGLGLAGLAAVRRRRPR